MFTLRTLIHSHTHFLDTYVFIDVKVYWLLGTGQYPYGVPFTTTPVNVRFFLLYEREIVSQWNVRKKKGNTEWPSRLYTYRKGGVSWFVSLSLGHTKILKMEDTALGG